MVTSYFRRITMVTILPKHYRSQLIPTHRPTFPIVNQLSLCNLLVLLRAWGGVDVVLLNPYSTTFITYTFQDPYSTT